MGNQKGEPHDWMVAKLQDMSTLLTELKVNGKPSHESSQMDSPYKNKEGGPHSIIPFGKTDLLK